MSRCTLLATLILTFTTAAHAAGQWTLTTADFQSRSVQLKTIDAAGVHLTPPAGGAEEIVPFDRFLDVSRTVVASPIMGKLVLHLAGGDQLGGDPLSIRGNDLIWSSPILGDIPIPMKQLASMTHPGATPADSRSREDVVKLANGDTLRGIVAGFADGKVTVQADAGNSDVPLGSVKEINFALSAGSAIPTKGFRVRFDDGSSVISPSLTSTSEVTTLALGKSVVRPVDLGRVTSIEQVNGPVSWLSSRPPFESVYVPFIGAARTNAARMDHNWSGQDPIRFGAQEFAHGIGVHSYSRLSWNLDGTYQTFRTQYAIDTKDANTRADVTVRVLLDGKVAYEQPHVRAGTLSPVVVEKLDGVKKLTLEVDYGDNLDTQDRFNWIQPALVR